MNESALADALEAAQRDGCRLALPSTQHADFDLAAAYRVAAELARRREARGDVPRGWKIGFTNRTIWPLYGVHQPIWGRVWRSSLTMLDATEAEVSLAGLSQPRLEPEIVFGWATTPQPGMDEAALRACLAWVAHGVEIVHTHYEGWRFGAAADAVADQGLHGRLVVGPRVPATDWPSLAGDLAALPMTLVRGDEVVDRGVGANVLDGPLQALGHGLRAMAQTTPDWRMQAGEVVTTGTLTDAWPVAPGQTWRTRPGDARLPGLVLHFRP